MESSDGSLLIFPEEDVRNGKMLYRNGKPMALPMLLNTMLAGSAGSCSSTFLSLLGFLCLIFETGTFLISGIFERLRLLY